MKLHLLCSFLGLSLCSEVNAQCNGDFALCARKYDEVAYLTTHNAFNSAQGNFTLPNQNYDLTTQLNEGVRGFMLDVYNWLGNAVVYHGSAVLGSSSFEGELIKIKDFLDDNPNEIVTVILECNVSASTIESKMNSSGLMTYVYEHTLGTDWPTLQTMIDNNTRCVVFSDVDDASASQGWYHYMWVNMVETHFSVNDQNDFTSEFNRGDSINDLFILNHFVTNATLGTGMEPESEAANSNPFFINRAMQVQAEKAKFPNFVTVDFYELGDALEVVDQLNGLAPLHIGEANLSELLDVFPNPAEGFVTIKGSDLNVDDFRIHAVTGKNITSDVTVLHFLDDSIHLDVSQLTTGVYFIQFGEITVKLVKR